MFRVDLPVNSNDQLLTYFQKYDVSNWLGKHELGAETGKPHYQMVIWSEHKKTNKQIITMRKYWTDRLGKSTCAIKSGRKIKSLCSYSTKDKGSTITNLPSNLLDKIPKWKNKTAEKALWNDKLTDYIENVEITDQLSSNAFAYRIMEYHKLNNKRPTRSNIQYLMWKYNKLSSQELLLDWKLIPYIDEYQEYPLENLGN
jgi:hypothetical protein